MPNFGTEKVGSVSGGEVARFFYLEVWGGAVLIRKKTDRRNAISINIPVANSFTPERAFFVTKVPFHDAKFLSNRASLATVFFLEFCPCQFRPECPQLLSAKIISEKSWKNSDANSRLHSTTAFWPCNFLYFVKKNELTTWRVEYSLHGCTVALRAKPYSLQKA